MIKATLYNLITLNANLSPDQRKRLDNDSFEPHVLRNGDGKVADIEVVNPCEISGPRNRNPVPQADRQLLARSVCANIAQLFGDKHGPGILTRSGIAASNQIGPGKLDAVMREVKEVMPPDRVRILDKIASGEWVRARELSFYRDEELKEMSDVIRDGLFESPDFYDSTVPLDLLERKVERMIEEVWTDPRRCGSRKLSALNQCADRLNRGDAMDYASMPKRFSELTAPARTNLVTRAQQAVYARLRSIAPSGLAVHAAMIEEVTALLARSDGLAVGRRMERSKSL